MRSAACKPLVMLHGDGSMIQELRQSGLFELRGALRGAEWWGPQSQAALLRSMLAQLGVERPVLFGHSFGALVALAFAS